METTWNIKWVIGVQDFGLRQLRAYFSSCKVGNEATKRKWKLLIAVDLLSKMNVSVLL